MRQSPGGPVAHRGGYPDSRLGIGGVQEPLAGRDPQLGQIFLNMRKAMNVSRETIARRLATRTSTIDDFEAGAVAALPHWKETQRIVMGYCELLRLDPQPILWRIKSQLDSMANYARQAPPPSRRPVTGPPPGMRPNGMPQATVRTVERAADDDDYRSGRRRRRVRTLFTLTAPVALLAGLAYSAQIAPQVVYPLIAKLPDQVEGPVRAGLEYVVVMTSPRRDGLRWIEIDPKWRKGDKLQTSSR